MDGFDDQYGPAADVDRNPQNVEAEAALLGALMIDNRLVDHVVDVQPEHFYEPVHGEIFAAIRQFIAEGKLANPVSLRPHFEGHESLKQAGGAAYLAQLTGSGAAVIGARDFAKQIIALFELRRMRDVMMEAIERIQSPLEIDVDPEKFAADVEADLSEALVRASVPSTVPFHRAFDQVIEEIKAVEGGAAPAGFTIKRFNDWNHVVGRMEEGDMILLGARPSMGKTAVAVTVALGAAENGIATDFLSLEMDRRKMTRRALAAMLFDPAGSIPYQDLIDGRVKKEGWRRIFEAREDLEKLPLTISDPPVMAVEDVVPHIRKRQREFAKRGLELKFVVLDYIGRLTSRKRFGSETELLSYISRTLKGAAKECGVALLALSQLSRALEQRENKRPMLADLRQSGSLEQDADAVVFLYRDEYYLERIEPKRDQVEKWEKWAAEIANVRDDMELYSSKARESALRKRISKFFTKVQAVVDHDDSRLGFAPTFFDDDQMWPEQRG